MRLHLTSLLLWLFSKRCLAETQESGNAPSLQSVVLSGYGSDAAGSIDGIYTQREAQEYVVGGKGTYWDAAGEHFLYWCQVNGTWGVAKRSWFSDLKHRLDCPALPRHPGGSAASSSSAAASGRKVTASQTHKVAALQSNQKSRGGMLPPPGPALSLASVGDSVRHFRGRLQAASSSSASSSQSKTSGTRSSDVEKILAQSQEETVALQHQVSEMLHRSTEQVQAITSVLMSNSKQTAALNTLYGEMERLTERLQTFHQAMDTCREDLRKAEQQQGQTIIVADDAAPDPLLGENAPANFLQLQEHVAALSRHAAYASQLLALGDDVDEVL